MFKFFIVIFIGAIISLILYACILVGKDSESSVNIEEMENLNESRKSN